MLSCFFLESGYGARAYIFYGVVPRAKELPHGCAMPTVSDAQAWMRKRSASFADFSNMRSLTSSGSSFDLLADAKGGGGGGGGEGGAVPTTIPPKSQKQGVALERRNGPLRRGSETERGGVHSPLGVSAQIPTKLPKNGRVVALDFLAEEVGDSVGEERDSVPWLSATAPFKPGSFYSPAKDVPEPALGLSHERGKRELELLQKDGKGADAKENAGDGGDDSDLESGDSGSDTDDGIRRVQRRRRNSILDTELTRRVLTFARTGTVVPLGKVADAKTVAAASGGKVVPVDAAEAAAAMEKRPMIVDQMSKTVAPLRRRLSKDVIVVGSPKSDGSPRSLPPLRTTPRRRPTIETTDLPGTPSSSEASTPLSKTPAARRSPLTLSSASTPVNSSPASSPENCKKQPQPPSQRRRPSPARPRESLRNALVAPAKVRPSSLNPVEAKRAAAIRRKNSMNNFSNALRNSTLLKIAGSRENLVEGILTFKNATIKSLDEHVFTRCYKVEFHNCRFEPRRNVKQWKTPPEIVEWTFEKCTFPSADRSVTLGFLDFERAERVTFRECNLIGFNVNQIAHVGLAGFVMCALGPIASHQIGACQSRRRFGEWFTKDCV